MATDPRTTAPSAALLSHAKAWLAGDPDPETIAELEEAIARGDAAEMSERFGDPIAFGTAGLRGVIGAGWSRMNLAVVLRATSGLADVLEKRVNDAKLRGAVIGYDGRRGSRAFAEGAARVLLARGFTVHLFAAPDPTPLCAFATLELRAAVGIMVTASHNPPEYNGYKVYWEDGAQIVPPIDEEIAKAIAAAPVAKDIVRDDRSNLPLLDASVERSYLASLADLPKVQKADRSLRIVHTALHGVGSKLCRAALAQAGFANVLSVKEQAEPDAAFPTVNFPNPEEAGALDLSYALAKKERADLIIANDPDADRLSVAIPSANDPLHFVQLTGNEVGALLGNFLLERAGTTPGVLATTAVSSPLLERMAKEFGAPFAETLTGFKWIMHGSNELSRSTGRPFLFGYEEALGYAVSTRVRDKDGISAAVLFAELAASLRAEGRTLWDELFRIYRRFGYCGSAQQSITRKGPDGARELARMMQTLREAPPKVIGNLAVVETSDYLARQPGSDMLTFALEGGHRVIARPSGTEPKAKIYFDVRVDLNEGQTLDDAKVRAQALIERLRDDMLRIVGVTK
ncbi:MAG: phospho-sugar mutase [Polyangiaceae bacterium]